MEQFFNYLMENPLIVAIAGGVLFVVTLIAIVKRLFSFVLTLALLVLCLIAAYAAIYPKEAMTKFEEFMNRDEVKGSVDAVQQKLEDFNDSLNQPKDESQ